MKTQINGKSLTHKFSVTGNSEYLDIISKTEFTVIINGEQKESIADCLDNFVISYVVMSDNLPNDFEFEIYGGNDVIIDGDGEITAEVVPDECYMLFFASKFTSIDMSKVNPKKIGFMFKYCKALTNAKVNLNGVSDIAEFFEECVDLTSFHKIDASNIAIMGSAYCEK